MRVENFPAVDHLRQRDGLVILPVVNGLGAVDDDDEIVDFALIVDFDRMADTAGHDEDVMLSGSE